MTQHVLPTPIDGASAPVLRFFGVRGSLPRPGPSTVIYGGNTSCIVAETPRARFIIDAGTGIAVLGHDSSWALAPEEPIHLLMTHLHHDHVGGLPFFKPAMQKGREIHVWCGNLGGQTAEAALAAMFAPPLFPFRLDQAPARFVFHGFRAGETLNIAGDMIRTAPLKHPSGATGYRFDSAGGSAAIITDIEHEGDAPDPAVAALCAGVDTLVYDMMFDESEYGACRGWGHSTASAAIALADAAGARRLVGFHHAPGHDDAVMAVRERRLQEARAGSLMAREGLALTCAPSTTLAGAR